MNTVCNISNISFQYVYVQNKRAHVVDHSFRVTAILSDENQDYQIFDLHGNSPITMNSFISQKRKTI